MLGVAISTRTNNAGAFVFVVTVIGSTVSVVVRVVFWGIICLEAVRTVGEVTFIEVPFPVTVAVAVAGIVVSVFAVVVTIIPCVWCRGIGVVHGVKWLCQASAVTV